jgi:ubiquinone/menaquinone biosynthesis C-methylase UbiE
LLVPLDRKGLATRPDNPSRPEGEAENGGISPVSSHYTRGNLLGAIRAGLAAAARTPEALTVDDLAPVDEFHIGGRRASEDFLDQMGFAAETDVLDLGCGLGGTARFVASRYRARVTGIDLTSEYIETGKVLCEWVGLADRVSLHHGSALDLPFPDGTFEAAYMMHAGMNIADKTGLCAEVSRVLRPGTLFGIYDVMRVGEGSLSYPVPWAASDATSFVARSEDYGQALRQAGFSIRAERNRRDFALDFFEQLRAKIAAVGGPPPLGLHILMGATAPSKVRNMVENIAAGRIAPVELIARKAC